MSCVGLRLRTQLRKGQAKETIFLTSPCPKTAWLGPHVEWLMRKSILNENPSDLAALGAGIVSYGFWALFLFSPDSREGSMAFSETSYLPVEYISLFPPP
jgi:hypothetical protein